MRMKFATEVAEHGFNPAPVRIIKFADLKDFHPATGELPAFTGAADKTLS
jgi:hypothetical protein